MEVRSVRTDDIKLIKFDEPEVNIRYEGRSSSMGAADSDPLWQIWRTYKIADNTIVEYANKGSFTAKWSDRTTYFSAATPDASQPLGGITTVTGTITPSGLTVGGLITIVAIDNLTWTALPATPLANRNAINVQNYTGQEIKLQFNSGTVGYVGVIIPINGERQYAITDDILVYAKSAVSAVSLIVEEIA